MRACVHPAWTNILRGEGAVQVERFEEAKTAAASRIDAAIARCAHYEKLLFQCQSCTAVDIRQREAEGAHAAAATVVSAQCGALLESLRAACDKLTAANATCASPFPDVCCARARCSAGERGTA
jgi:hypothetical protein